MNSELWTCVKANAAHLNIDAATLMAVVEVESAGKYFAVVAGKSEPLIRFEGHYFDRRLTGPLKARARLRGIASPIAGAVKNPVNQKDRWALLEKACALSRQAALESTSWGIGQVMGAHWKWLGYGSVEELVETARSGLIGQVELMVRFIEKSGLTSALQAQNWTAFARGYNGAAYAKLGYHIKLADAYEKSKIAEKSILNKRVAETSKDIVRKGGKIEDLQSQLKARGYVVAADGVFDGATEGALKQSQGADSFAVDSSLVAPKTKEIPSKHIWQWLATLINTTTKRIT